MGKQRQFGSHVAWSTQEVEKLHTVYSSVSTEVLKVEFPNRSLSVIQSKAWQEGLRRPEVVGRTTEQTRESKRKSMAARRAGDIEGSRAYQMNHYFRNHERNKQVMLAYQKRRFFWRKAQKLKGVGRAETRDLAKLWKAQKGRCALTGRRLDRSAQLDHITPIARGGDDTPTNLQWLCKHANLAKRDLTDAEFLGLCREVINHAKEITE